ncbi:unnamed protein product [Rotaria sp. Silwood2]|nr:unnamed protein product [Rotaria sp. Silwood2]
MSFVSENVNIKQSHNDHDYAKNINNTDNNDGANHNMNAENVSITDENIEEIEKFALLVGRPVTKYEIRLKEAAKRILQHTCAVISNCSLTESIDYDAANSLVEGCLLQFTEDLFADHSQLEPEGFVKYIPDNVDIHFINRLLCYDIDPTTYLKNIDIPEIWMSYLSANGRKLLKSMKFYQDMFSSRSSTDAYISTCTDGKQNDKALHIHDHNLDKVNSISKDSENKITHPMEIIEFLSPIDEPTATKRFNVLQDIKNICKPLRNQSNMKFDFRRKYIIGLKNIDKTTCYINASLQCLASTPPLVDWLFNQSDQLNSCKLSTIGKFCSICELTRIITLIHPLSMDQCRTQTWSNIPSADRIRNNIGQISPVFSIGQQEDASEFIITFLDHCISCWPSHFSNSSIISLYPTVIDDIFSIKLLSSGRCPECSYIFLKKETTNVVLLEVDKLYDLTDALLHFVNPETVNQFKCSNCNQFVGIKKRITFDQLSPILIINFKRCALTFDSIEKLKHRINYDEILNFSPYMTANLCITNDENDKATLSSDFCYKLYAIINHTGENLTSGHYYAYIRSSDNIWFLVDDEHCQSVTTNEVINHSEALILFYAKFDSASTNTNTSVKYQINTSTPANSRILYSSNLEHKKGTSLELLNISSIPKSPESIILNDEPLRGQTHSSITIGERTTDASIFKKRKINDHRLNKNSCQSSSSSQDSFLSDVAPNNSTINSIHDEETRKQDSKTLASVASGVIIEETFEETLSQKHHFRLNQSELIKLNLLRQQNLMKEFDRKMQSVGLAPKTSILKANQSKNDKNFNNSKKNQDVKLNSKVNIEYLNILLPHLKHYNAACGLCIRSRYFGKNMSTPNSLLLRCILKCNGAYCHFKCTVHVLNNGYCFIIALNQKVIHHVGERISRPIRGSQRQAIIDKFKSGASVHRLHTQYSERRSAKEKRSFNYDFTGKSKAIFKKIKAEATANSLLSPDVLSGILQLHDQLANEINHDGIVNGAIQLIQFRPFCTVVFTEASIRLYDTIVSHPETVLSWDATGGIIKNSTLSSKQCLYYELTVSHPNIVNEDTLVPLTFMLSESQTLHTVTNWLLTFKENHKKVFPHKKDSFPKPVVIISDRAQIFLQAALRVFNEETYQQFFERAYRIVNHQAIENDLSKTIIHACLSHFMLV